MNANEATGRRIDWFATAAAVVLYFIYILGMAFYPAAFSVRPFEGFPASIGLIAGIAMVFFLVGLAAYYMIKRESADTTP